MNSKAKCELQIEERLLAVHERLTMNVRGPGCHLAAKDEAKPEDRCGHCPVRGTSDKKQRRPVLQSE